LCTVMHVAPQHGYLSYHIYLWLDLGTNPPFALFLRSRKNTEIPMADNNGGNRKTLALTAGAVLVVVGLFVFVGGNNDGQPPGNPTQTDQGR